MVVVMSDGMQSFMYRPPGRNPTPVPMCDILREYLAFKGTKGQFVYRRANKATATLAADGVTPVDDISLAAIYAPEV